MLFTAIAIAAITINIVNKQTSTNLESVEKKALVSMETREQSDGKRPPELKWHSLPPDQEDNQAQQTQEVVSKCLLVCQ